MAYIKKESIKIGDEVILTKQKESMAGYFEAGTRLRIIGKCEDRGYSFQDDKGNVITEAGFDGFKKVL